MGQRLHPEEGDDGAEDSKAWGMKMLDKSHPWYDMQRTAADPEGSSVTPLAVRTAECYNEGVSDCPRTLVQMH